jgi:hypothetical protein
MFMKHQMCYTKTRAKDRYAKNAYLDVAMLTGKFEIYPYVQDSARSNKEINHERMGCQ